MIDDKRYLTVVDRKKDVLRAGQALSEEQVIAHCRSQLAPFKSPKKVVFVDALPKNPSSKILKRELRTRFEALLKDLPAENR